MSRDYKKLRVFKMADELAVEVYRTTKRFPKNEMFGITSQLRRAALSVPTNIVEGSHRSTIGDYLRFLDIALGSLAETGYLIDFSARLGYLDSENADNLRKSYLDCIRSLKALIKSLRSKTVNL
ncbi:MAG: four helix bundle protein [candidate division Zixibacteria bacterium]|nr:four helix bundle protein [Candidatus Tariuqbacter arcticus]